MSSGQNQIVYLEQTVEQFFFIPSELSRILNTIKALDDKCHDLSQSLQDATAQLLAMPPAYQVPPGPEYFELMKRVATEQKMLTQFSEEKVQLAQQTYDLLEMHALELERTLENFESDMRISGLSMADGTDLASMLGQAGAMGDGGGGGLSGGPSDMFSPGSLGFDPAAAAAQIQRGRTPKLEDWNLPAPTDVYDSLPLPLAPGQPPQAAILPAAATAGPAHRQPTVSGGSAQRTGSLKRPRSEEPAQCPPLSQSPAPVPPPTGAPPAANPLPPLPAQPGSHSAGMPSSQTPAPAAPGSAPQARTQSVSSMLNAMADEAAMGAATFPPAAAAAPPAAAPAAAAAPAGAAPAGLQPSSAPPGLGGPPATDPLLMGAPAQAPPTELPPAQPVIQFTPPPGLLPSAPRPQAPGGRVLTAADVGPGLRGRLAELYWPDDASWYLIEIQDVNVQTMKARIVYTTGEVEELDMDEIARDRHMMLLPADVVPVHHMGPAPAAPAPMQ